MFKFSEALNVYRMCVAVNYNNNSYGDSCLGGCDAYAED